MRGKVSLQLYSQVMVGPLLILKFGSMSDVMCESSHARFEQELPVPVAVQWQPHQDLMLFVSCLTMSIRHCILLLHSEWGANGEDGLRSHLSWWHAYWQWNPSWEQRGSVSVVVYCTPYCIFFVFPYSVLVLTYSRSWTDLYLRQQFTYSKKRLSQNGQRTNEQLTKQKI